MEPPYLYAVEYHEDGCQPEPEAMYALGEFDENMDCLAHTCIEAWSISRCRPTAQKNLGDTFDGFPNPLPADYKPNTVGTTTYSVTDYYEEFKLEGEGRTCKVRVFDLRVRATGKRFFVAFEVEEFPTTEHPETKEFKSADIRPAGGGYAYTLNYFGRSMLFLLDRVN